MFAAVAIESVDVAVGADLVFGTVAEAAVRAGVIEEEVEEVPSETEDCSGNVFGAVLVTALGVEFLVLELVVFVTLASL
jgi:hypothetical protein